MKIVLQKLFAIYAAVEQVGTEADPELVDALAEEITYKPLVDVVKILPVLLHEMVLPVVLPPPQIELNHVRVTLKLTDALLT